MFVDKPVRQHHGGTICRHCTQERSRRKPIDCYCKPGILYAMQDHFGQVDHEVEIERLAWHYWPLYSLHLALIAMTLSYQPADRSVANRM